MEAKSDIDIVPDEIKAKAPILYESDIAKQQFALARLTRKQWRQWLVDKDHEDKDIRDNARMRLIESTLLYPSLDKLESLLDGGFPVLETTLAELVVVQSGAVVTAVKKK